MSAADTRRGMEYSLRRGSEADFGEHLFSLFIESDLYTLQAFLLLSLFCFVIYFSFSLRVQIQFRSQVY